MASLKSTLARKIVFRFFKRLEHGGLKIIDGQETYFFGDEKSPLQSVITVQSAAYRQLLRGSGGMAAAYMAKEWECDDLVTLIRIAALNTPKMDAWRQRLIPITRLTARLHKSNTPHKAKQQIAQHYDLGNQLFELFLDPTMSYSCAVFKDSNQDLHQASLHKLQLVCDKLKLQPTDHLLEIGTGWGELAVYAAQNYGCKVTTTTISKEQELYTKDKIKQAGLENKITVLDKDYRLLEGQYDKLVSIEMIEAVGWRDFDTFFSCCDNLLKPDGMMLLQAITIEDEAYEVEKSGASFIKTYIFPGGCLPSQKIIKETVAKVTSFKRVDSEDITEHYATTLNIWRRNFALASEKLNNLGYDERFQRLWGLYLAYCEGGFRERRIQDIQLLLAKTS